MPGGLLVDLVHDRAKLAGFVGAQSDGVPGGRPETAGVERLRARQHRLDRPAQPARDERERREMHLQRVLLAETAADVRRDDHDVGRVDPQLGGEAVAHRGRVLRALVHDDGVALPVHDAGQKLHRHLVLRRLFVGADHSHRAGREGRLRIADPDVGQERQRDRLLLYQGGGAGRVDADRERLPLVLGVDQHGAFGRGDQVVGHDQRDRLASIGDLVAAQRLQALHRVPACHDETDVVQFVRAEPGHHESHAGHGLGGRGVDGDDAALANPCHREHRMCKAVRHAVGTVARLAGDLLVGVDAAGVQCWGVFNSRRRCTSMTAGGVSMPSFIRSYRVVPPDLGARPGAAQRVQGGVDAVRRQVGEGAHRVTPRPQSAEPPPRCRRRRRSGRGCR